MHVSRSRGIRLSKDFLYIFKIVCVFVFCLFLRTHSSHDLQQYLVSAQILLLKYLLPIIIECLKQTPFMYRAIPSINKHVFEKELQRNRNVHLEHLRSIRPAPSLMDTTTKNLNNKKKQMLVETRFTEIERQNRLLLQKITGIMSKGRSSSANSVHMPQGTRLKSLNLGYRKRQCQRIEIDNAKLLQRLQDQKSEYGVGRMNREWRKKQRLIKNMSTFPVVLFEVDDNKAAGNSAPPQTQHSPSHRHIEMRKIVKLASHTLEVTLRLDAEKLIIAGYPLPRQKGTQAFVKVIDIPRNQAMDYIMDECGGQVNQIFEKLDYDGTTLFLLQGVNSKKTQKVGERRRISKSSKKSMSKVAFIQKFGDTDVNLPRIQKTSKLKSQHEQPSPPAKVQSQLIMRVDNVEAS